MSDINQLKKAVCGLDSLQLCTAMDAGVRLSRKSDPCHPIKSAELHLGFRLPILRVALGLLVSAAVLCALVALRIKGRGCRK